MIQDFVIDSFHGLNTAVRDAKTLKVGFSPNSLNWVTSSAKDSISIRRGYARLGATEITGNGKVTGLGVGTKYDGSQVVWYSYGRKVKYYDAVADDMVEVGTDMLPVPADGEDVWFEPYQGLSGSFVFVGSPNSGIYKIPSANPANAVDQAVNNYRFNVFHVGQNRAFAGQRNGTTSGNNDKTGLYLSYIDKDQLSDFTHVTAEALGAGGSLTYSGTLVASGAPKTVMYVEITDGTETFKDDRNGNLVGSAGGTGTINYATGAYSVTFKVVAGGNVTADYYHETSTSAGILDFTGTGNGQGKSFRQDDGGGNLKAIFNINTIEYCFHVLKTWQFTATLDDTQSTNLPYRNVGIPYERSAHQTPEGIIFADLSRPTDPKFRRMEILAGTNVNTIEPTPISDALDLSGHAFDKCVAFRWGDYEIFCVQEKVAGTANAHNSVMYIRNVVSKVWDRLNYYASCLAEYEGTLVAGDSVTNNVYTLFSGFDEDGDVIENYWTSSELNLGTDNLKTCRRMVVDGLIVADQSAEVQVAYDGGEFSTVYTIEGNASYVDAGISTSIGAHTIGSKAIGGGAEVTASPFEVDFPLNSDRFVYVTVRLVALGIGALQVNSIKFSDIRNKGKKNIPSRTV